MSALTTMRTLGNTLGLAKRRLLIDCDALGIRSRAALIGMGDERSGPTPAAGEAIDVGGVHHPF